MPATSCGRRRRRAVISCRRGENGALLEHDMEAVCTCPTLSLTADRGGTIWDPGHSVYGGVLHSNSTTNKHCTSPT